MGSLIPVGASQEFLRENYSLTSQERKALEDKEAYIQIIMEGKGVSREVAEAEYDFFIGSI